MSTSPPLPPLLAQHVDTVVPLVGTIASWPSSEAANSRVFPTDTPPPAEVRRAVTALAAFIAGITPERYQACFDELDAAIQDYFDRQGIESHREVMRYEALASEFELGPDRMAEAGARHPQTDFVFQRRRANNLAFSRLSSNGQLDAEGDALKGYLDLAASLLETASIHNEERRGSIVQDVSLLCSAVLQKFPLFDAHGAALRVPMGSIERAVSATLTANSELGRDEPQR